MSNFTKVDGTCSLVASNSRTVVCKTPKGTFSLLVSTKRPSILRKPKQKQPCVAVDVKIEPEEPSITDERPFLASGPDKPRPVEVKLEEQQPCEEVKTEPNEPRILEPKQTIIANARRPNASTAPKRRFVEVRSGVQEKNTLNRNMFPVKRAVVPIQPKIPEPPKSGNIPDAIIPPPRAIPIDWSPVFTERIRELRCENNRLKESLEMEVERTTSLRGLLEIEVEKTKSLNISVSRLEDKLRSSESQLLKAREECINISHGLAPSLNINVISNQVALRDEKLSTLQTIIGELKAEIIHARNREHHKIDEIMVIEKREQEELLTKLRSRDVQLEKVREECRGLAQYRIDYVTIKNQVDFRDKKISSLQETIKELKNELQNTKRREKHAKENCEKKAEEYDQLYQSTLPERAMRRKPYNELVDTRSRKERFERYRLFLNDLCQTEDLEVINQFLHDYKMFSEGDMNAGPVSLLSPEQGVEFMRTFQISYGKLARMKKMFNEMTPTNVLPSIRQIRKFIFKPEQAASPEKEDDNSPNEKLTDETVSDAAESEKAASEETGYDFQQDLLSYNQEDLGPKSVDQLPVTANGSTANDTDDQSTTSTQLVAELGTQQVDQ